MFEGAGEDRLPDPIRRFAITWTIVFGLIIAAFAGTILALNATLYSAPGFVGSYLESLARRDVEGALATPGVRVSDATAADLLTPAALARLADIRLISDTAVQGLHRVVYEFSLDGTTSRAEFTVERTGTRLGFFPDWSFATSPTAALSVTTVNETRFDANGVTLDTRSAPGVAVSYDVLTPGMFSLGHTSTYLTSAVQRVAMLEPGVSVDATVTAEANSAFVGAVQTELNRLLDACVTQAVLKPTGCPFGETITNRIEGTPTWSMARYPAVTVGPGNTPGTWVVPETPGAAHLIVAVRSLFDGSLSTFDEDVPFTVSYLIRFAGGGITIIAR